jgi:hypothetical protein
LSRADGDPNQNAPNELLPSREVFWQRFAIPGGFLFYGVFKRIFVQPGLWKLPRTENENNVSKSVVPVLAWGQG